jgi:hypothetical protein
MYNTSIYSNIYINIMTIPFMFGRKCIQGLRGDLIVEWYLRELQDNSLRIDWYDVCNTSICDTKHHGNISAALLREITMDLLIKDLLINRLLNFPWR